MISEEILARAISRYIAEIALISEIEKEPVNKTAWTMMLIGFDKCGKGGEFWSATLPLIETATLIGDPQVTEAISPIVEKIAEERGHPIQMVMNSIIAEGIVEAFNALDR